MINQIVTHTPTWVWGLLLALLWLGLKQSVARTASLRRITLMPLVMTGLSLYGAVTVFGPEPAVIGVWLGAAAATGLLAAQQPLPAATRYDPLERQFSLPGSWVPLLLIMGIFMTKYGVGVATSLQPALVHDRSFGLVFVALYGAFSGVFLARAACLWRLVWVADAHSAPWVGAKI